MRPIRQLSASVVNKIAAGEVIERPASVVKELLENSIDAGATRIELALENGGTELIRITDNGCGIPVDQLQLAVTPHATSKIADADELFSVATFGFRGEALASITEVSQALIRSRPAHQDSGFELTVHGGHRESEQPCGAPVGTTIEIRRLFYNTPVREKFLKTPQTEKGHIIEAFTRIALAHPEVQMTLLNNDKPVYQLPGTDQWQERIDAFFGAEISESLIPVASQEGEIEIEGYVVDPSVSRSNNRMQYLFLNNRYIRDRSLQHALSEAYRGLLMTGRFPICFLRMKMPFSLVDVNVHPAKLEVRFQNAGVIYSQLLSVIRNRFLTTDLTAYAQLGKRPTPEFKPFEDSASRLNLSSRGASTPPNTTPPGPSGLVQSPAGGGLPSRQNTDSGPAESSFRLNPPVAAPQQTRFSFPSNPSAPIFSSGQRPDSVSPDLPVAGFPDPAGRPLQTATHPPHVAAEPRGPGKTLQALQVHNTYLIQETEEGMVVIDQHALHERVIYEQLRHKFRDGQLESQRLLVPEPITLPADESAAILDAADLLGKLGIQVEPFGGDTLIITSYPAMLANQNPADVLGGVIDKLMGESKNLTSEDLIDELLHMISCKAAVKAGDKLSPEEITALLEHRELCQDAHHCPHGRPTALVFSREELDRRFKRI
jgi:DNA mismatch repair protein MutL